MRRLTIALTTIALAALIGCNEKPGEDRPGITVINGNGGSVSVSASGAGPGSVSGTAGPGNVFPKPADAHQVNVELKEWAVIPDQLQVKAGRIYFLAKNTGPADAHEMVIIKSDLAADKLPTAEGRVLESQVELVDEIRAFTPNSSASLTANLQPGNYLLICNIAETEEGKLESHYELGMRASLKVVP